MASLLCAALLAVAAPTASPAPNSSQPPPPAQVAAASGPSAAELEILRTSLQPGQRMRVDVAVRGLQKLPLYRVVVRVEPASLSFHGQEQVRTPVSAPTQELDFRLFDDASYLNGGRPTITVSGLTCPGQACTIAPSPEPTLVRVAFAEPVPAGAVAAVNLDFDGVVPALPTEALNAKDQLSAQMALLRTHGGSKTDHGAFGAGNGVLALSGMFPQLAAHWGGDVDRSSPSGVGDVASFDLANYLVTADVPAGFVVAAAGAQVGDEVTHQGRRRFTYAAAAVRDFALYASDAWQTATQTAAGATVTAYTLKGDAATGKKVLGVAAHALAAFAKRFGPYPWSDLRVVEQPLTGGAGGIEYPTVVGVGSLLYSPSLGLGSAGGMGGGMGALAGFFGPHQRPGSHAENVGFADKAMEFAVAHEVAHQWWSALVGSDPHHAPAVDEALAQFSAALYVEDLHGKRAGASALKTQVAVSFQMMRQTGESDGAVERPTDAFDDPLQYAGLVYGKAPLFYGAVRKALGDAAFDRALRRYATDHRFGEARPGDFTRAAIEEAPGQARSLHKLRAHWLLESHGDADLGPMDLGAMVEDMTGMPLSPQAKMLMQQMMPQLMQMLQSGVDPSQLLGP